MHIQELARRLGATVEPSLEAEITGVATIDDAGPSEVTFLANEKYLPRLKTSRAGAVLVTPMFEDDVPPPLLRIQNPYLAFAKAIELFYVAPRPAPGVHPTAVVGKGCTIGKDVSIGAFVVVGAGVTIGDGVVLHPHVVVYDRATVGDGSVIHSFAVVREGVSLGKRVVLQNGAVVGADGFGFAPIGDGRWHKIPQSGTVILADDVEVQANTCIDRATVGATTVGRGTKMDNLVQVGHGCHVGEDTLLCGQVGLAGSTEVGNRAMLAGQVGVAGHLKIGDGVSVGAQAGVIKDLEPGSSHVGSPSEEYRTFGQLLAATRKLPDLIKRVKEIEKRLPTTP